MPQLPRVAVLGPDLTGAVGLAALVDGGIDATYLGAPTPAAEELLSRRALTARRVAGPDDHGDEPVSPSAPSEGGADFAPVVSRAGAREDPRRGFQISLDGRSLGSWDAVVVTAATVAAVRTVIGVDDPWYGGVFHPRADGVYLIGGSGGGGVAGAAAGGPAGPRPAGEAGELAEEDEAPASGPGGRLVWAQASWVGEYLRGRYLLPAYQAMLDHPGLRRVGLRRRGTCGYLRALERELRAGRARAAAAGYPLPIPAAGPGPA
ncbi:MULTISPECIES: hypothetical protein [Pseudofrankia]|uniref:hypothetical protein n=1 Tax=Pseudofrankia TaxID=2994363 RepID=UPI000234D98C|nr:MULTISPECIES: hypothetical protein [Pseudofrankia]OHV37405.1 hypothetical protein BCD49_15700 [Pseudofrankia sp. EUN1h]